MGDEAHELVIAMIQAYPGKGIRLVVNPFLQHSVFPHPAGIQDEDKTIAGGCVEFGQLSSHHAIYTSKIPAIKGNSTRRAIKGCPRRVLFWLSQLNR